MPAKTASSSSERLPRFRRRPQAVPAFTITERDEEILKIVARYRFATSAQIIALIGTLYPGSSEQQVLRRLQALFHAGYLSRPRAQIDRYNAGGSRPMIYSLGNHGMELLAAKHNFRRVSVDWTAKARTAVRGELDHALEITEFAVELELACRSRGTLQVIHFDEILATLAPEETRASKRPYQWPVALRWQGSDVVLHPTPDRIFGVRDLERADGRNRRFFFLEADRGTMPTERRDLTKTSMLRKIVGYAASYRHDLHTRRYGLPNVRILTVTPGRQRIANIIATYREHAATLVSPKLFLFADRPGLSRAEDWLQYPWVTADGEQVRLLD